MKILKNTLMGFVDIFSDTYKVLCFVGKSIHECFPEEGTTDRSPREVKQKPEKKNEDLSNSGWRASPAIKAKDE
jgi:hypothetical protein